MVGLACENMGMELPPLDSIGRCGRKSCACDDVLDTEKMNTIDILWRYGRGPARRMAHTNSIIQILLGYLCEELCLSLILYPFGADAKRPRLCFPNDTIAHQNAKEFEKMEWNSNMWG